MEATGLSDWIRTHNRIIKASAVPLIVALIAGVYIFVYLTGGIKYVYSHSMYLAILLAGFIFGIGGGVAVGVLAGITLGPFMPIDILTGEPQETINWLYRTGFFVMVGFLSGAASDSTRLYLHRIKWLMRHDFTSGLPNRYALVEDIKEIKAMESDAPSHSTLAVISVENAPELEATYGPEVIDVIIKQLADRLEGLCPGKLTLYRTSTQQLGMMIGGKAGLSDEHVLANLSEVFVQPFSFGDISIHCDLRAGYARLAKLDEEPEHYLRKAEVALRIASEKLRDWVAFTPELDSLIAKNNLELLGELKAALSDNQLALHYQPKVSIRSGSVYGVEALMRWHHPRLGNVPPGEFIPRAEQSTLIDMITEWAIDQALAQVVNWKAMGIDLTIAVNISVRNLMHPDFVDTVLRLLDKHQVSGESLELEVTEGAFITDIEHTVLKLFELTKVNIIISIDDFGTGYSSLQYLNDLPVSIIKIDQSFVRSLQENSTSSHIVQAAVNLAHELDMSAVAEGVEDENAYHFLHTIGCDIAQGYFISRALPADELTLWYQTLNGRFPISANQGNAAGLTL